MFKRIIAICAVLLWCGSAFGAHPLVTDDTGTQGAGKFQLELTGEYAKDGGDSTKGSNTHPAFVLGGLIYTINKNFNSDVGIKASLNKAEPDYTVLAGLEFVFGGNE